MPTEEGRFFGGVTVVGDGRRTPWLHRGGDVWEGSSRRAWGCRGRDERGLVWVGGAWTDGRWFSAGQWRCPKPLRLGQLGEENRDPWGGPSLERRPRPARWARGRRRVPLLGWASAGATAASREAGQGRRRGLRVSGGAQRGFLAESGPVGKVSGPDWSKVGRAVGAWTEGRWFSAGPGRGRLPFGSVWGRNLCGWVSSGRKTGFPGVGRRWSDGCVPRGGPAGVVGFPCWGGPPRERRRRREAGTRAPSGPAGQWRCPKGFSRREWASREGIGPRLVQGGPSSRSVDGGKVVLGGPGAREAALWLSLGPKPLRLGQLGEENRFPRWGWPPLERRRRRARRARGRRVPLLG